MSPDDALARLLSVPRKFHRLIAVVAGVHRSVVDSCAEEKNLRKREGREKRGEGGREGGEGGRRKEGR